MAALARAFQPSMIYNTWSWKIVKICITTVSTGLCWTYWTRSLKIVSTFCSAQHIKVTVDSLMCMSSNTRIGSIQISNVFYRYKLDLNTETIKFVEVLLEFARFGLHIRAWWMNNDLRISNLWRSTIYPGSSSIALLIYLNEFGFNGIQWRPFVPRIKPLPYFIQFYRGINRLTKTNVSKTRKKERERERTNKCIYNWVMYTCEHLH